MIWGPVTLVYLYLSIFGHMGLAPSQLLQFPPPALPVPTFIALARTALWYSFGCLFWTFVEYSMHRFVFHMDDLLPDNSIALLVHFIVHGIHHFLPMDRLRLVMPPLLFFSLSTPFVFLAHSLFPAHAANGIIAGAFTFYLIYDMMHYALHHTKLPQYLAEMKRYHLAHHYKSKLSCARQFADETLSSVSV